MSSSFPIRISSLKLEGILQASKWLKIQLLLDSEEMQDLLAALGLVHFVVVSQVVEADQAVLSDAFFLKKYEEYVCLIKQGLVPQSEDFRRWFSCAMSTSLEPFYAIAAGNGKYLIKSLKPVIQLQAHHFFYSELDRKFHPMVLSDDSITWGLQFSYPQLYQNLETRQIVKVLDTVEFPNSALFSRLLKWMRSSTLPTPFEVGGVRVNSPIRIGKKSLAWIKNHPQLKKKEITISPHCQASLY
jgi:hypothetical protein